ncbi:histidine kinase [Curvibacter sp. APW13]|uniref:sensor histidine kinase n=1 Tax=Curvibacter sp. APW13 TaxID=3077236 RepID=UPI0028DF37D9|nr:histidine kinase [Curvibacter sp. APW13]MDT8992017.1 histidine kinase [Curvibacter sp. APW13]
MRPWLPNLHGSALSHLLPTVVLNTVIALGITVFGEESFLTNWVYSQCIGLLIGSFNHLGIRWFIRDWDSQWRRIALVVPVGSVLGFIAGVALGDTLLGHHSMEYWTRDPRKAWGFLVLSLVCGIVITHFFASRAQLARARESAEIARRQAAEAQLRLLQSQLEPHMLFNTLANLRVLIGLDAERAQHMLDHLVNYLRATLDASRATEHSLQQEFDRLRDYLELMAVRMGARLRYRLDLPEDLAAHPVPPLLLQALVENAIQHGLEPKVDGGEVRVSAQRTGNTLALEVLDTGIGSRTDLNAPGANRRGFGVEQVRERLATRYGNAAAIVFEAPHAGGTRANITIPLQA